MNENNQPSTPSEPQDVSPLSQKAEETPLMTLSLFHEGKGYRASVDFPEEHNLLDTIRILETAIFVLKGTKDKFLAGEDEGGEFFEED